MKQVCRRHGYLASFMCLPRIPNVFSSGWHMHQSLRDKRTGANALVLAAGSELLSPVGQHYLAGLLEHAPGSAGLAMSPTINGYRRFGRHALAPHLRGLGTRPSQRDGPRAWRAGRFRDAA